MGVSGNRLVNRFIVTGITIVVLFSAVWVLGSSSTDYAVIHTLDIDSSSTSFSESFTLTVGPLSWWRIHVLELREQYSGTERVANLTITINAELAVNGAEAEGFTRSIDSIRGGFSSEYQLILPQNLLHIGENIVTLTYHIEVEGRIEQASSVELVYSGYRIRTI